MLWINIILIASALVVFVISFVLLLRDKKKNISLKEGGGYGDSPKELYIYSSAALVLLIVVCVLFVTIYQDNGLLFSMKRLLLLAVIWTFAYTDVKTYRIPNCFILLGLILRAIILALEFVFFGWELALNIFAFDAIAAAGLFIAAILCGLVLKNSIGMGDIKLFVLMGLMLGMDGIWSSIFVSLLITFFASIYLLITKKKTKKESIPFGPFLVIGTFISVALTGM